MSIYHFTILGPRDCIPAIKECTVSLPLRADEFYSKISSETPNPILCYQKFDNGPRHNVRAYNMRVPISKMSKSSLSIALLPIS